MNTKLLISAKLIFFLQNINYMQCIFKVTMQVLSNTVLPRKVGQSKMKRCGVCMVSFQVRLFQSCVISPHPTLLLASSPGRLTHLSAIATLPHPSVLIGPAYCMYICDGLYQKPVMVFIRGDSSEGRIRKKQFKHATVFEMQTCSKIWLHF